MLPETIKRLQTLTILSNVDCMSTDALTLSNSCSILKLELEDIHTPRPRLWK
jgi:hypothetical protein